MGKIYLCPHCATQNFATRNRLLKAETVPVKCWKCGKGIRTVPGERQKREPKKRL